MLEKHVWKDFAAVTFSIAIVGVGLGCTLPLTAMTLTERGFGTDIVGFMIAAAALGGIVGTVLTPSAVMQHGRRRVMLASFMLASLSTVALQFSASIVFWMLMRGLFGAAMAALFQIGEAWINMLPGQAVRGRVVAIYTTSFTLFQVAGPLVTDWLMRFPHSAFLLCGVVFLAGIPGILVADDSNDDLAGPSDASVAPTSDRSWWQVLRAAPVVIAGTAFFASFDTIILGFLPLAAMDRSFSRSAALLAPSLVLAGDATLQFVFGWLSDHVGRRVVHGICGVTVCVMLPCLFQAMAMPYVWPAYLFVLGGVGGALYTLSMVESGDRFAGAELLKLSGLIGLTWNLSSSAGPALTGALMRQVGSGAMVAVLFVMALVFVVCLIWRQGSPATVTTPN